jgi:TolB protein
MRRVAPIIFAALLMMLLLPGSATASLRDARVEGYHEGPWVRTRCTYTNCNELAVRGTLRWGLTPTRHGVSLHSYSGGFRLDLRWVADLGIYRGARDLGRYWRQRIDLRVVERRMIDGTWTATKLTGEMKDWSKGAPKYHRVEKFTIHRHFGFGKLVFQASQHLAMMDGDGTNRRMIGGICEGFEPSWRPSTNEVAFIHRCGVSGTFDVSSIGSDGTGLHELLATSTDEAGPDWSNDGRLTMASDQTGDRDVYVMNADGTGLTNITNNAATDTYPAFSPDGTEIVFVSDRGGSFDLYLMNSDGTNVRQLTSNPADDGMGGWGAGPAWSPNGQLIAFESDRAGKPEIYLLELATGHVSRVTSSKGSNVTPAISPDGKRIAFSSDRSGGFDIYTVGLHGQDLIRVSKASTSDYQPDWVT